MVNGFELLQRLFAGDGVDQDEGVAFGDGQALHGGELVAPRGVSDLEGAHAFVAADHLAVGVLHRGDVGVPEGALDETQDQGALPDSPRPKHHHAIVVALLRHSGPFRLEVSVTPEGEKVHIGLHSDSHDRAKFENPTTGCEKNPRSARVIIPPSAISAPVKAKLIGSYELVLFRCITVKHLWGNVTPADR